VRNSHAIAVQD